MSPSNRSTPPESNPPIKHLVVFSSLLFGLLFTLTGCGPPLAYHAGVVDLTLPAPELESAHRILLMSAQLHQVHTEAEVYLRAREEVAIFDKMDGFDQEDPLVLDAAAEMAYADKRPTDALKYLQLSLSKGQDNTARFERHLGRLLEAKEYLLARRVSFQALDLFDSNPNIKGLADRAIDEDEHLLPKHPRRLIPDQDVSAIKALGGGSTITLKFKHKGRNIAAFKPDQTLQQSMYRSEIAYYRLCEILGCSFRVPYNEPVEITRAHFDLLYARVNTPKQRGYAYKFTKLVWVLDPGKDARKDLLLGTSKEWVPKFINFVIESTSVWGVLLQATSNPKLLKEGIDTWLTKHSRAAGKQGWKYHRRLAGYMEGMTAGQIAEQISELLVVDYLVGNWDRFSGREDFYGANCHFEPGGFIAIDNGAAFPLWEAPRVLRRLLLVQRFSKRFVRAIRRLDHDQTLTRLFPGASREEKRRFEFFWGHRTKLLERVDMLVARFGAEKVLIFD